jgi:hypothetical protein
MASTIEVIKKTIGGRIINGAFRAFSSLARRSLAGAQAHFDAPLM